MRIVRQNIILIRLFMLWNDAMKTLLTKHELWCYWNCSRGYTILVKGTVNQIQQFVDARGPDTMRGVRLQYGIGAYTVLYRSENTSGNS